MATVNTLPDTSSAVPVPEACLLVYLTALAQPQIEGVLTNLTSLFSPKEMVIATSDATIKEAFPPLCILSAPSAKPSWTLTAADFMGAYQIAQLNKARGILILGPESDSLSVTALRGLAREVTDMPTDLAVPHYDLPPHAGLVNSAILYPLSRALFASPARFPLAIDYGFSIRMAERLAIAAQRCIARNQGEIPIWPVSEAAVAGFSVREIGTGPRRIPHPAQPDLHTILSQVAGSLFSVIEEKAAFWQRARQAPPPNGFASSSAAGSSDPAAADITSMLHTFRLAYTNLQEIWSLVLPPNTLLGLKRLSLTEGTAFRMSETLWARIVYDFVLAYRLRTINRGHLLGALVPLYLAWVASHINVTASGIDPERHVETTAAAFESEKPYLVARWRWPDRFNP